MRLANGSIIHFSCVDNPPLMKIVAQPTTLISPASRLFDADRNMLKLLPFRYHKDYMEETEFSAEVSSSLLCSGHFPSFAMLLIGTKRLKQITALGIAIQAGACALGFGISVVMTLLGTFGRINPSFVIIYNLVFLIATLIAEKRKV